MHDKHARRIPQRVNCISVFSVRIKMLTLFSLNQFFLRQNHTEDDTEDEDDVAAVGLFNLFIAMAIMDGYNDDDNDDDDLPFYLSS